VGVFDLNQLGALDTAGATLLALLLGEDRVANLRELAPKLPEERRILLETVSHVLPDLTPELSEKPTRFWLEMLANTGRSVDNLWQDIKSLLGFIGLALETLLGTLFRPPLAHYLINCQYSTDWPQCCADHYVAHLWWGQLSPFSVQPYSLLSARAFLPSIWWYFLFYVNLRYCLPRS
jgi:hypothetical protein